VAKAVNPLESLGMSVKRIFWQDASAGNWCKWFGRKWVVQRLVNRGAISFAWCAIGCRKVNSCEARLIDRTTVVRGDVCDQQLLERVLGEYEFDTVLHLAAQSIRHHSKPKIRFRLLKLISAARGLCWRLAAAAES
jgi:hypothetical protein